MAVDLNTFLRESFYTFLNAGSSIPLKDQKELVSAILAYKNLLSKAKVFSDKQVINPTNLMAHFQALTLSRQNVYTIRQRITKY